MSKPKYAIASELDADEWDAEFRARAPRKAIQHLEKIAESIRALEGNEVDFRLARKLSDVLKEIEDKILEVGNAG